MDPVFSMSSLTELYFFQSVFYGFLFVAFGEYCISRSVTVNYFLLIPWFLYVCFSLVTSFLQILACCF